MQKLIERAQEVLRLTAKERAYQPCFSELLM